MHNTCTTTCIQLLDTGEAGHSTEYAMSPEIKPLNRFANIVVCKSFLFFLCIHRGVNSKLLLLYGNVCADDDNRIVLKPLTDASDCQRDYINACYVDVSSVYIN